MSFFDFISTGPLLTSIVSAESLPVPKHCRLIPASGSLYCSYLSLNVLHLWAQLTPCAAPALPPPISVHIQPHMMPRAACINSRPSTPTAAQSSCPFTSFKVLNTIRLAVSLFPFCPQFSHVPVHAVSPAPRTVPGTSKGLRSLDE